MATLKTPNKFHSAYNPINFEVYEATGKKKEYTLKISYDFNGKEKSHNLTRPIPGVPDSSGPPTGPPGLPGLPTGSPIGLPGLPTGSPIGPPGLPTGPPTGPPGLPTGPPDSGEIHSVTFDISGVVRNLFGKDAPEMKESVEVDNRLFARYTCEGQEYIALNTTDNISLSLPDLQFGEKVLSSLPVFRKYEGYDFDISLLCGNEVAVPLTPCAVNRVKQEAVPIRYLKDKQGYILDEDGNYILIDGVNIVDMPVPRNPFYIRWINRFGGVDYYMFGSKQQISVNVKDIKTLINYPISNNKTIDLTAENQVIVGASGLSRQEWEEVSLIAISPDIEWYNEKTSKWQKITVSKSENVMDTDMGLHSLEITFNLPTLQTQFA